MARRVRPEKQPKKQRPRCYGAYGLIYKATNKIDGKEYVGQTIYTLRTRRREHERAAGHKKDYFHNAINKYGKLNFYWLVIDYANDQNKLNEKEVFYIKKFRSFIDFEDSNGYNLILGSNVSESTKNKLSEAGKNREVSKETRAKLSKASTDRKHSLETKKKIAMSMTGKKRSNETKLKISQSMKRRKL